MRFPYKKAGANSLAARKTIHGVGINDAAYIVQPTMNGKQVACPFYRRWKDMIDRCYSKKALEKHPNYKGCKVCDEWLTFSKFKIWMYFQDWAGMHLDKDILTDGNKVYGPNTCRFITPETNTILNDCRRTKGELPIGVHRHKEGGFVSQCCDGLGSGRRYLGIFGSPDIAHQAWRKAKATALFVHSGSISDPEISLALISRALKLEFHNGL